MSVKKEKKFYNEKTWALDCRLARMQKLIWGLCAVMAIAGAWLIMQYMQPDSSAYGVIALALTLMAGYQWAARAPQRALNGWMAKRRQGEADSHAALAFVEALEKKLPFMKKREMAFSLTNFRAILLFDTGKQQEAVALLEQFDCCWDESQRKVIDENIRRMKETMGISPDEKEENA